MRLNERTLEKVIDKTEREIAGLEHLLAEDKDKLKSLKLILGAITECNFRFPKKILNDSEALRLISYPQRTRRDLEKEVWEIKSIVKSIKEEKERGIIHTPSQQCLRAVGGRFGPFTEDLGAILTDFIDYICKVKGHKIGVGDHLINKYITILDKEGRR